MSPTMRRMIELKDAGPGRGAAGVDERPIGRILVDMGKLRPDDVARVFLYHREKGLPFGEAARRLHLVSAADVQQALAIQFDFPYLQPRQGALSRELIAAYDPFDRQTETLRELRTHLLLHWFSPERKMLAIVSPDSGDGKSYLAANLAVVFAQMGENTLLIDANLRAPRQHRVFGLGSTGLGLAQALSGRTTLDVAERVAYFESLSVLAAGTVPPNPLELLSRAEFCRLLEEAAHRYTVILIDTPAAALGADARIVAARAAGALLVARQDKTRVSDLRRLQQAIVDCGAALAGTVMNRL